jgi:hypothetical protein
VRFGEAFGDPRRAENLRERFGLLFGEAEERSSLVRVVAGVDHDIETTRPPGDNADAVPVADIEFVSQADTRQ